MLTFEEMNTDEKKNRESPKKSSEVQEEGSKKDTGTQRTFHN